METFLEQITRYVVLGIQTIAVVVIAIGVVQVVTALLGLMARRQASYFREREVWLSFARWLVAGLTLQLASDIVQTAVAPSWDEIGRLAAIAAIRTFLSHFLDRDVDRVRARQQGSSDHANPAKIT